MSRKEENDDLQQASILENEVAITQGSAVVEYATDTP